MIGTLIAVGTFALLGYLGLTDQNSLTRERLARERERRDLSAPRFVYDGPSFQITETLPAPAYPALIKQGTPGLTYTFPEAARLAIDDLPAVSRT